jgi:hypothetical protein
MNTEWVYLGPRGATVGAAVSNWSVKAGLVQRLGAM